MKTKSISTILSLFLGLFGGAMLAQDTGLDVNGLRYTVNEDGESVTVIGGANATMVSVIIPDHIECGDATYRVTAIADHAFVNCPALAAVTLPATIGRIGERAFDGFGGILFLMEGLTTVANLGASPSAIFSLCVTPPEANETSFVGSRTDVTLHVPPVPSTLIADYFEAPYWQGFTYRADARRPEAFSITPEIVARIDESVGIVTNSGSVDSRVAWSSLDPSVATVSATGRVTIVGQGETHIVATCYDHVDTCHVVGIRRELNLQISPQHLILRENETAVINAVADTPLDDVELVWSSDNRSSVAVNGHGRTATVLGIATGTAFITVKSADNSGLAGTCRVDVNRLPADEYRRGDVNGDGMVDVADMAALTNVIVGSSQVIDLWGDGDIVKPHGVIDVADLNALTDIILGKDTDPETREIAVNGITFKMIKVDGGSFTMGATGEQQAFAKEDERPAHQVTVSDFWMAETEVTQGLVKALLTADELQTWQLFTDNYKGDNMPCSLISYENCEFLVDRLNALTGCHFRLPTEAEWEYAARGGKRSRGFVYAGSDDPNAVAWYVPEPEVWRYHEVAQKKPNELGLYDMSGNVWEWCSDYYDKDYYAESPEVNPTGPENTSVTPSRVIRGGDSIAKSSSCRVSARFSFDDDGDSVYAMDGEMFLGFRLVCDE